MQRGLGCLEPSTDGSALRGSVRTRLMDLVSEFRILIECGLMLMRLNKIDGILNSHDFSLREVQVDGSRCDS